VSLVAGGGRRGSRRAIVTAPISITAFLVWQFLTFLDTQVEALLPARYNPENYLPFSLPGVGLLVVIGFLTLVGMLTANLAGRTLVRRGQRLLSRVPVVRRYGTLKQIFETVLAQSSRSFREVVLIEYPRRGIGAIGFVTEPTRARSRPGRMRSWSTCSCRPRPTRPRSSCCSSPART
jgi:uncharacterized membrane protein